MATCVRYFWGANRRPRKENLRDTEDHELEKDTEFKIFGNLSVNMDRKCVGRVAAAPLISKLLRGLSG